MAQRCLYALKEARIPGVIGNKAENLRFMARHKYTIPATWVCHWGLCAEYDADATTTLDRLRKDLVTRLDTRRSYAVRSSADLEDRPDHSFAGQFDTILNAHGPDEITAAIEAVWLSTHSAQVQSYLEHHNIPLESLHMGVIVQEMVESQVAGVAFSRNPMTGLNEVIVEAVKGSGVALVQSGLTPRRWVNKWGTWTQQPEDEEIPLAVIEQVVRETKGIARAVGKAVDLEWVYDGETLYWVQMRPITTLDVPVYSHKIPREMLPGIIKPLVWSVNIPMVNSVWVRILTEMIGPNEIDPLSLAGHFYYRVYFNMAAIGQILELMGMPRETLELMMGLEVEGPEKPSFKPSARTYALLPRMLRFAVDKLRFETAIASHLSTARSEFESLPDAYRATLDEERLLEVVDRNWALVQQTAYYNILIPLLGMMYARMFRGQLAGAGVDPETVDLAGGMPGREQYDPAPHLTRLNAQYRALDPAIQAVIAEGGYQALATQGQAAPFLASVDAFVAEFGHLSDSGNDFTAQPWRETPDLILDMVANYVQPGPGTGVKQSFEDLSLPLLRGRVAKVLFHRAQRFGLHREAISSLYTYGYGRLRDYFLTLGDRFVRRGLIDRPEDIFYLYLEEVRAAVRDGDRAAPARQQVAERRAAIEAVRDIVVPETIYGDEAPPIETHVGRNLQGIPTSRGRYTGTARVLSGIQDMGKMEQGDVLVIPYSDVGWTPLFARAGAVIAESGGVLSHSSIIAREYGIPAVVSVPNACAVLDGVVVSVDGYRGEVHIHTGDAHDEDGWHPVGGSS